MSTEVVTLIPFDFATGGDVITAVNGETLNSAEQLNLLVSYDSVACETLQLEVLRDGEEISITITVEIIP